jgi:4-amino-4-deoxy-L-arabinose transferase-like glycosyltransferase
VTAFALAAVTLLAAFLRLFHFGSSPPGLNQDEAINAWNAFCMLRTGHDMVGAPWPIFYAHAIGDNRTTLWFYVLLPFQALGGLNVWTARLPAALAGILSVPLVYFVGARLFGHRVGLLAALLMAFEPWPLLMSRWGLEASLCPLLALLAPAVLLWAGLPPASVHTPPRAWRAAIGGAAIGIACYGYPPLRIYFPPALMLMVIVSWSRWRETLRSPGGARTAVAFVAAFAITFGPLVLRHLTDPAIARRAEMTRLWEKGAPLGEIVAKIAARWLVHFDPRFLFVRGDPYPIMSPPDQGMLHWYMLPLLVIGLIAAVRAAPRDLAARIVLALVATYPAGDLIARYEGAHALRSSPGIGALILLAAFGAIHAWRWLRARGPVLARTAAGAFALAVLAINLHYLPKFFGEWNTRPQIWGEYHVDLIEACRWLRPRLDQIDAVFITTRALNQPFAASLVELEWDPNRWFREPRDVRPGAGGWDLVVRYGKMHFLYADLARPEVEALERNGRDDRGVFIVRPHELGLADPDSIIHRPDGTDALWIFDMKL